MAKQNSGLGKALSFVAWLTGVIVALSVGFAMIDGILGLPSYLGGEVGVSAVAGWIVVLATIAGVVMAIIHALR